MEEENIYPIFDRMLSRKDKEELLGQRGVMLWLTGLSGSGKSTIAIALERELHKRGLLCRILDGHYYFFASIGSCCEGLKSTYTTVVGRSDNLFGPYVNKNGGSMMDNKHEVLIQKSNSFVGTGHNSEIVTDNAGNDWFFYHAVSTKKPEGRVLMLDKISWEDGWPTVEGSVASTEAEKPKF